MCLPTLPSQNAYMELPFGANPGLLWGALWPELLHQLFKGLVQYAIQFTVAQVEDVALLDRAIASLQPTRQSDRVVVPQSTFPDGVSNVTKIHGQEFPALLLQLMAVLAADIDGQLLKEPQRSQVLDVLDRLFQLGLCLDMEFHLKADLLPGGPLETAIKE